MNEDRYRLAEGRLWSSVGATPTERFVRLDRTGCRVRVQEAGRGTPILFVHGASNGGTSWAPLAAQLDGCRAILLDRPGCGLSEPLGRSLEDVDNLAAHADALVVDVLDALDITQAPVVGTSYGGYLAIQAAAAHPDRISHLVVYGWPYGAPMAKVPLSMRLTAIPFLGRLLASVPPNERAVRAILNQIGLGRALANGRFTPEALSWFTSLLRDTPTMRNELDTGPRTITPIKGMNRDVLIPGSVLARITVPAFFLWGVEDPMGGADLAGAFVRQIPGAQLELMPRAGHAVWIDDPSHTAHATVRFLRRERET